jgi:uncharacterized protein YycO
MNKPQMQTCTIIIFSFFLFSCYSNHKKNNFELKPGDLLFQNTGTVEVDNDIKDVTATSFSKNYSHVGIAMQKDGKWLVVEAIPKEGVRQTPLIKFLNRNKNKFNKSQTAVARLNSRFQPCISIAIAYGLERINIPNDDIFLWDDSSYYCSELVYKMFSSQNSPTDSIPFLTQPMTFKNSVGNKSITYTYEDCYSIGYLYFSMNWGWQFGSHNGCFAFDNYNPASTTYNNYKKMIYNITP